MPERPRLLVTIGTIPVEGCIGVIVTSSDGNIHAVFKGSDAKVVDFRLADVSKLVMEEDRG